MADVGMFTGAFVLVLVLSFIWEKLVFQRAFDDPVRGKVGSVIAGWLTAGVIAGFGMADGGSFKPRAFVLYFIPAVLLGLFAYHRGRKLREDPALGGAQPSSE